MITFLFSLGPTNVQTTEQGKHNKLNERFITNSTCLDRQLHMSVQEILNRLKQNGSHLGFSSRIIRHKSADLFEKRNNPIYQKFYVRIPHAFSFNMPSVQDNSRFRMTQRIFEPPNMKTKNKHLTDLANATEKCRPFFMRNNSW